MGELEDIRIVEFEPRHAEAFRDLNLSWIREYFKVEEIDRQQLYHPEVSIIQAGGAILVAENCRDILGVCGLRFDAPGRYEVTKMAVREGMRGRGIGRLLLSKVISHALRLGAQQLFIISNTVLAPAIHLYRKLGFVEAPCATQDKYDRANIALELNLMD